MKKIFMWIEDAWAMGKIHRDVAMHLSDEFEITICDWTGWAIFNEQKKEFDNCDIILVCYAGQDYVSAHLSHISMKKCIFVSYGFAEMSIIKNPSHLATYGMASRTIEHLFPSTITPFYVPICVELSNFNYKEHLGSINNIGWCGAPNVLFKQFHWAQEIAKKIDIKLRVSSKGQFEDIKDWVRLSPEETKEFYSTLDILLITSIPNGESETGPLPAFEAIASGVLVIGTPVGNFKEVPGPKFSTVEEAVQILNELKSDPERVKQIAKEQYDCIVEKWNYKVVAEKWKEMFRSALKNAEST